MRLGAFQGGSDQCSGHPDESVLLIFWIEVADIVESDDRVPADHQGKRGDQPLILVTVELLTRRFEGSVDP